MEGRIETKFRNAKFALSRGYRGIAVYTQYTPPVYTVYFVYIRFTVYTHLLSCICKHVKPWINGQNISVKISL
jgi:hypothetical protein